MTTVRLGPEVDAFTSNDGVGGDWWPCERIRGPQMRLEGHGVVLRPLEETDLEHWREWVNDPEIAGYLDRVLPVSRPEHRRFFYLSVIVNQRAVWFALERPGVPPRDYIGCAWLWDIDQRHRRAEVRILIGERSSWGTGVGTEALRLLSAYAFEKLGLHKLYAYVHARNPRGAAAFRKAVYVEEARLREEAFWDGAYDDVLRFGLWRPTAQNQ